MSDRIEELQAIRAQLAYRVGQGEEGLESDLDHVEDQLARVARERERAQLAAAEAARRAEADAAREREDEAARREAHVRALLGSRHVAAGEVERTTAALIEAISRYLEIGKQAYALSGGQHNTLGLRQLEAFLVWKLTEILPRFAGMPKPAHAQRRPLTELLAEGAA